MAGTAGRLSGPFSYNQAHAPCGQSNPAVALKRESLQCRGVARLQENLGSGSVGPSDYAAVIGSHIELTSRRLVDCEQLVRGARLAGVRHECSIEIEPIPPAWNVHTVALGFVEGVDELNQALCLCRNRQHQCHDQGNSYKHRRTF